MSWKKVDVLQKLYWKQEMSIGEIAEKFGLADSTIQRQMVKLGIPRRSYSKSIKLSFQTGRNFKPRLGRKLQSAGYILVYAPNHPKNFKKDGYILEHRLVWEKAHGPIPEGWFVHHINGIKSDNRLSNLVALPNGEHVKKHGELRKVMQERIRELERENKRLKTILRNYSQLKGGVNS